MTNYPLLKNLQRIKDKIILSTGMSNLKEIVNSLNIIANKKIFKFVNNEKVIIQNKKFHKKFKKRIIVLHCVTDYPVENKYANLSAIENLKLNLKLDVGYSDHTLGILAPLIAVSKGAKIIEKHFTLNNNMPGPDHKASLEPNEFKKMVEYLRIYEVMNGDGKKICKNVN